MLDQDNNFYLISLNILITCLLDNVWAAPDTSIKEKRLNYIFYCNLQLLSLLLIHSFPGF